jgi:WD40 repeat protein
VRPSSLPEQTAAGAPGPGPHAGDLTPAGGPSPRATLRARTGNVLALAYSPDGRTLACGCGKDLLSPEGAVELWDCGTGKLRQTLKGHTGGVRCVAYAGAGEALVSGGYDKTVRVWDLSTGVPRATLKGSVVESPVASVAVTGDGKVLAMGNWILHLFELATTKERAAFIWADGVHRDWITSVAFSPDDGLLAAAGWEGTVKLWDVRGAKDPGDADDALARLRRTKTWDERVAKLRATLRGPVAQAWSVAFSPDGTTLAAAFEDGTVRLWDPASGKQRSELRHAGPVKSVAYAPDGKTLAAGCEDGTVTLWDSGGGKERRSLAARNAAVTAVAFALDGKTLAVACGSEVTLWDVAAADGR